MTGELTIHGIRALPGESSYGSIPVATMASGVTVAVPIHVINGYETGPKLLLTSVLHGGETFSIEIVREVLSRIDSQALRGAVIAVPVANPVAFDARTRLTPTDSLDLNRIFASNAQPLAESVEGRKLTERLAELLADLVSPVDCVLDYHCGTAGMAISYIYVPDSAGGLGRRNREIAGAYGLKVMYLGPGFPGSVSAYALDRGIPALVPEIGGEVDLAPTYLESAVRGVFNVMKHLGMLEGAPEPSATQVLLKQRALIRSTHGGILHTEVGLDRLNEVLSRGETICRVVSPMTFEELETITAPYETTIPFMLRARRTMVQPGDTTCFVGNWGTAEILSS